VRQKLLRRIADFFFALLLTVVTFPIWLLVIVVVLIGSPGKPFFTHARVGRGGRAFRLIKFRTMSSSKDGLMEITVSGDQRVTRIGRLLRRFKLDELPQLLNILTGSMTFVGPRPESPKYVALYTPTQLKILDYLPGLTDPASLKYRYEEEILAGFSDPESGYIQTILPDKIVLSLEYQKNRRWFSDIKIIGATFAAIFRRHEAQKVV
jgi:lipopolysaccharide/colanic/teichoic acid biosynthesis glycosyltransferase